MDHLDSTVRRRLTALAAELDARVGEIVADVDESIQRAIPGFADDTEASAFREASIAENVSAMLRMVRIGIDAIDVAASDAALHYARHLAQHGTPPALLVRCYRVGQSQFLRHCLEGLSRQEVEATVDGRQSDHVASIVLIDQVSDYIDRVLEQVLTAYEQARQPRPRSSHATDAPDDESEPGAHTRAVLLDFP